MFNITSQKDNLNQISLTGMRAIILLGMLMVAPRSLDDIKKSYVSYKIMEDNNSNDTIRVDLNTLKYMGCEISRSSQKTDFKYVLGKNPFLLKVSKDDIKALKKVYGEIKKKADIKLLIEYHNLFEKISQYVSDEEIREALLGVSELKRYKNLDTLKELLLDCEQERTLELVYSNVETGKSENKNVIAKKLVFNNDKIYLYAYDMKIGAKTILNFKRIKQIISRKLHGDNIEVTGTKVKFRLDDVSIDVLSDEEAIIEASDKGYVVEGLYYNDFLAMQRILSFGEICTVLEPEDFKEKIISKLRKMRDVYDA